MAVIRHSRNIFSGKKEDGKPLNVGDGVIFFELNSNGNIDKIFLRLAGNWLEFKSVNEGGGGGTSNHSELNLDDGTNPHRTTKEDVGLGNVDNTSDVDKPISNAVEQALLDLGVLIENNIITLGDTINVNTELERGVHNFKYLPVNSQENTELILNKNEFSTNDRIVVEQSGQGFVLIKEGDGFNLQGLQQTDFQYDVLTIFFKSPIAAVVFRGSL